MAMPNYVQKQLTQYNHPKRTRPQDCSYSLHFTQYGAAAQELAPFYETPQLSAEKPDASIHNYVSDMMLNDHSNASYLVAP